MHTKDFLITLLLIAKFREDPFACCPVALHRALGRSNAAAVSRPSTDRRASRPLQGAEGAVYKQIPTDETQRARNSAPVRSGGHPRTGLVSKHERTPDTQDHARVLQPIPPSMSSPPKASLQRWATRRIPVSDPEASFYSVRTTPLQAGRRCLPQAC